jgi:hypothetical protein
MKVPILPSHGAELLRGPFRGTGVTQKEHTPEP